MRETKPGQPAQQGGDTAARYSIARLSGTRGESRQAARGGQVNE